MKNNGKRQLTIGILSHVDGGKTTLSRYLVASYGITGEGKSHKAGDAFLDFYEQEAKRGITIFTKPVEMSFADMNITLLDTPGHKDFASQVRTALPVMDVVIFVVDGNAVSGASILSMIREEKLPCIVFVNKMDMVKRSELAILEDLRSKLNLNAHKLYVDDDISTSFLEEIATCDEDVFDAYMKNGTLSLDSIFQAICSYQVTPVIFGSAISGLGVDDLLKTVDVFSPLIFKKSKKRIFERINHSIKNKCEIAVYDDDFNPEKSNTNDAKIKKPIIEKAFYVYRIFNENSKRLAAIRMLTGSVKIKEIVGEFKIQEILEGIASDSKTLTECREGQCATVAGLNLRAGELWYCEKGDAWKKTISLNGSDTCIKQYVDIESNHSPKDVIEAFEIMGLGLENVKFELIDDKLILTTLGVLDGQLVIDSLKTKSINCSLQGFFTAYCESVQRKGISPVFPVADQTVPYFYIEASPAKGLQLSHNFRRQQLDEAFAYQLLEGLKEKLSDGLIRGPLFGKPLCNLKLHLFAGRGSCNNLPISHIIDAATDAVQFAILDGNPVIFRPRVCFALVADPVTATSGAIESMGSAMGLSFDKVLGISEWIEVVKKQLEEEADNNDNDGEVIIIHSKTANMNALLDKISSIYAGRDSYVVYSGFLELTKGWQLKMDMASWKLGETRLFMEIEGYERDFEFVDESDTARLNLMNEHLAMLKKKTKEKAEYESKRPVISDEEINRIMLNLFSKESRPSMRKEKKVIEATYKGVEMPVYSSENSLFIVDGYNMMYRMFKGLNESDGIFDGMREALIEKMENYAGFTGQEVVVVFDGYKRVENQTSVEERGPLTVVFTKHGETADRYIEKFVYKNKGRKTLMVATSDRLEQMNVFGQGAVRLTAEDFIKRLASVDDEIKKML